MAESRPMNVAGQGNEGFRWDRLTGSVALGYCMLVVALSAGVVLGELRDEFAIGGTIAALHGSTFGIGLIVMAALGVRIVGRWGRGRALRASIVMMIVGAVLFGTGNAWQLTLAGTAVAGIGAALYVVIIPGLIHDHHGAHRATAFAAVNGLPLLMALVISLSIGATLSAGGSWRTTYAVILVATTIIVVGIAGRVAVPDSTVASKLGVKVLTDRVVLVPWLQLINAVVAEFVVGVWAASYLLEVGGASSGLAPALAGVFGLMMFASRVGLARLVARFGNRTIAAGFATVATGALIMCFGTTLPLRVVGLMVIGFGAGPLYPLCVERLYVRAESTVGPVALGAVSALASGVGITVGPLLAGVVADIVGLRWSMLATAVVAVVGIVTQYNSPHRPAVDQPVPVAAT